MPLSRVRFRDVAYCYVSRSTTPRLRKSLRASTMSFCSSTAACGHSGNVTTDHATVPALYRPKRTRHASGLWRRQNESGTRTRASAGKGWDHTHGESAKTRTSCSARVAVGNSCTVRSATAQRRSAKNRRPSTSREREPIKQGKNRAQAKCGLDLKHALRQ